jgi:hypothetical protein
VTEQPEDPILGAGPSAGTGPGTDASGDQGDDAIHFHFPIDIQVIGRADDDLIDQVVGRVFDELRSELERRA